MTEEEYADFYRYHYHGEFQDERMDGERYDRRYLHDYLIAKRRNSEYQQYIHPGSRILDIGSGNGAFVDYMVDIGHDAWGIELNPEFRSDRVSIGDLAAHPFDSESFDVITMHDVLEHLANPVAYVRECHRMLRDIGLLIIDFPNFWVEEGKHHWKHIEHLWFLDRWQLGHLLERNGFRVVKIDYPIPSKLVIYSVKDGSHGKAPT